MTYLCTLVGCVHIHVHACILAISYMFHREKAREAHVKATRSSSNSIPIDWLVVCTYIVHCICMFHREKTREKATRSSSNSTRMKGHILPMHFGWLCAHTLYIVYSCTFHREKTCVKATRSLSNSTPNLTEFNSLHHYKVGTIGAMQFTNTLHNQCHPMDHY